MELKDILKELYAGKKITLSFKTIADRDSFRVRLYKAKSPQDKALEDICDEEKMVLRFEKTTEIGVDDAPNVDGLYDYNAYKAKIWLENKSSPDNFEVISIE